MYRPGNALMIIFKHISTTVLQMRLLWTTRVTVNAHTHTHTLPIHYTLDNKRTAVAIDLAQASQQSTY